MVAGKRIHVLGAGAIGLLHAFHIRTHLALPTTLILRDKNRLTLFKDTHRSTITLYPFSPPSSPTSVPLTCTADAESLDDPSSSPIDLLLVTTRAPATLPALKPLLAAGRLKPRTVIVLLQNGVLAVAERVEAAMEWTPRLVLGSTTHGVTRDGGNPFAVRHVGVGETVFGLPNVGVDGEARRVAEMLGTLATLGAKFIDDPAEMRRRLLLKLAINASINPLAALTSGLNGDTLHPPGPALYALLARELHAIVPEAAPSAKHLEEMILEVARKTAANRNSMAVDVLGGRETEQREILGWLVEEGRRRGLSTGVVETLGMLVEMRAGQLCDDHWEMIANMSVAHPHHHRSSGVQQVHVPPTFNHAKVLLRPGTNFVNPAAAGFPLNSCTSNAPTSGRATPVPPSTTPTDTGRDSPDHRSSYLTGPKVLHPGDKTQPAFLLTLMHYIRSEFSILGNPAPGDFRRLQVLREAFEAFINEFRTYSPILSEIKGEYEGALAGQAARLKELEALRCQVEVGKYQAAQELLRMRNAMEEELMASQLSFAADFLAFGAKAEALTCPVFSIREVNRRLASEKDSLESEIKILNSQIQSLSEEVRRNENALQSEELARKRLHDFQEQMELLEKNLSESLLQKDEELAELKKAARKAHDGVKDKDAEIARLRETLAASIALSEYEAVAAEKAGAVAENAELKTQLAAATAEIENLKAACAKKDKQLKASEGEKLPNWEYIAMNCPGPIQEWGVMCRGMDFNDTIIILIRHLLLAKTSKGAKQNEAPKDEKDDKKQGDNRFFVGYGVGSEVPKYLRYRGKIPNRRLSKKDCTHLVSDLWKAKSVYESTLKDKARIKMTEFIFLYLKRRFGTQDAIAEWGYNLLFASQKHTLQSVLCRLFHEIVTDSLDEEVYYTQQAMIEHLKTAFQKYDTIKHEGRPRGILLKAEVVPILREFWPWKTDEQLNQLIGAIEADQSGDIITYQWLFHHDSDPLFLEIVREQDMEARDKYINTLEEKIRSITKDPRVSASDLLRCLSTCDPLKPRRDIDAYLSRGFAQPVEAIKPRSMITVELFLRNLKKGVLEKTYERKG
ncbi:Translin-associated factor X-interacting protein 1 [Phlyctochytrium bullatum]|nr:Translin-associated factor X-interacting protein 1 [Phlyctochytrium bullatum]